MRVTSPSPAVAARTPETKGAATAARPAVAAQPAVESLRRPPHGIVDGGCFPPFPGFPSRPSADAKTRATQGDQLHDIADGVRDGSLTEQETETLLKEQQAIADAQKAAMADGKLSLGEKLKLAVMQARADHNIDRATNNRDRDWFAGFDSDAQTQADQIDQIANGRTSGNITNSEAGKLLDQQASIADSRDNGGKFDSLITSLKQREAQQDINLHSRPGTQFDFQPLPFPGPRPLPLPRPFPLPEPLPRPQLPSKPVIDLPVFRTGVIVP